MGQFNRGGQGRGEGRDRKSSGGSRDDFGGGEFRVSGVRTHNFSAPREMHKAICSECNQECEVPFKPSDGKPVYCRNCYQKHRKF